MGPLVKGVFFIPNLKLFQIPKETRVHKFSNYYFALKRKSCPRIPDWSSFSPMEVVDTLPWMAVIERKNESLSGHRFRLIGESVKRLMGKNYSGSRLDEVLTSEKSNENWEDIQTVVKCREPSFTETAIPIKDRDYNKVLKGCFPFCDENKEIIRLIIVLEML